MIPRGVLPTADTKVGYIACEVSWGSRWVNINDGDTYRLTSETKETSARTWRKTVAESPVLGGNYLIHAVPDMVAEQIGVWVYGNSQTDVADNLDQLEELFTQWDFRIRWTQDEYRETWRCQLADSSMSQGHVWTHNQMAKALFTVPRYPDVTKETLG